MAKGLTFRRGPEDGQGLVGAIMSAWGHDVKVGMAVANTMHHGSFDSVQERLRPGWQPLF